MRLPFSASARAAASKLRESGSGPSAASAGSPARSPAATIRIHPHPPGALNNNDGRRPHPPGIVEPDGGARRQLERDVIVEWRTVWFPIVVGPASVAAVPLHSER